MVRGMTLWLFITLLSSVLYFHLKEVLIYLPYQVITGSPTILTLVKDWLMFFTSIWRKLPIIGRGVGPGGSFLLLELCLQSERRMREERVSTRKVTRSMETLLTDPSCDQAAQRFYNMLKQHAPLWASLISPLGNL